MAPAAVNVQPTAFPRGKRKKQSGSSSTAKDDQQHQPSKKRATTSSSSTKSTTTSVKENDFLFGNNELDPALQKKSRSSSHRHHTDEDDDGEDYATKNSVTSQLPLGGGAVLPPTSTSNGKRIPPKIELLTFSKFAKGTKVLGVIREVCEDYALVSLPTMLTGFVRRDVVEGGPLTKVLPPVNTIMAFYVMSTTTEQVSKRAQKKATPAAAVVKKRRIELSPLPVHVNRGVRMDEYLSSSSTMDGSSRGGSTGSVPMVVRGRITSMEDHGCIVDLGGILGGGARQQKQAFLKFENVEGDYEIDDDEDDSSDDEESEDEKENDKQHKTDTSTSSSDRSLTRKLNIHRIYDFAIMPSNILSSSNDSSSLPTILQLALPSPTTLAKLRTLPKMMPSLSSLQPGMLTEVQVEVHARNGMCVSFKRGVYRGSIDEDHLGGHRSVDTATKSKKLEKDGSDPSMWWKSVFKGKHTKFTARIVAVDTTTKIVRFSLNPHILALNGEYAAFPHPIGAIIKNAQVIRVDPGIGALLALPPIEPTSAPTKDSKGEEQIAKMDQELSNNLLSNSEYRAASNVHTAYVHISKSMDNDDNSKSTKKGKQGKKGTQRTPEGLFARHFSINTRIASLRILSTSNLLDNIASCATAKSIVDAHVLTHADLKPGTIYKDVPVLQLLESGGVLVDLGVGTKGIVPAIHLFDKASHGSVDSGGADGVISGYRQKIRSAKYKIGNLVSVRCLTVEPATRQCVLTAKKTLLANNVEDPILDYPSIQPGHVAAGFISKVEDTGLIVTFYNNVYGRVSSRSLAAELGVEDVKMNYSVGDVVLARVVGCERRRNRHLSPNNDNGEEYYYQLRLSLKTVLEEKKAEDEDEAVPPSSAVAEKGDVKDSSVVPFAAGSLLMPKRMKVLQLVKCLHRDDGVFLPGYAVVSIKSKFLTGSSGSAVECKLPYEQLLDSYGDDLSNPPMELDQIAQTKLRVGKRIDAEGIILTVPVGVDMLPIVSLRPSLIDTMKKNMPSPSSDDFSIICPSPKSNLFMGEYVRGYVTRIDKRFGAFVRFFDGLTGLIPKLKKGLDENLYDTILCRVTALDITSSPPKILLKKVSESEVVKKRKKNEGKNKGGADGGRGGGNGSQIQVGHIVGDVKVADINFARAKVYILDNHDADSSKIRARIHVTMADVLDKTKLSKKEKQLKEEHKIGKRHPFYSWKVGDVIPNVRCVAVDNRDEISYVELSNLAERLPSVVSNPLHLPPGSVLSAIVTSISSTNSHHGLWVQVCPGISGFVPALELSTDPDALNDLPANYKVGTRIKCCVMQKMNANNKKLHRRNQKLQTDDDHDDKTKEHQALELSVLLVPGDETADTSDKQRLVLFKPTKPHRGDSVVGRIHTKSRMLGPPSLTLNLRGGHAGRCCITELADTESWENMPLGKSASFAIVDSKGENAKEQQHRVVSSDSDADLSRGTEEEDDASNEENETHSSGIVQNDYPEGKYVKCRVLGNVRSKAAVELSLRDSRLEGDNLDNDAVPTPNDMIHAYVVSTTKMGCFVRLSRSVEGRVILKELSDEFLPNPGAMFPQGRLVVGKVKSVKKPNHHGKKGNLSVTAMLDIDMRESVLLVSGDRVTMDDIQENAKYTGVITRVESYGVFVRIDNSDVSGLAHVSECSDTYIKNIQDLYNPGDLVKLIVIKMEKEQKRLAFSLKASNFVDDDDSDDDSTSSSGSESSSDAMDEDDEDHSVDSEDGDFASKLAKKMESGEGMDVDEDSTDSDSEGSDSDSDSDSESSDSEEDESEERPQKGQSLQAMQTDVGFDWGSSTTKPAKTKKLVEESSDDESSSSSDSSEDESDDADSGFKSSHRARKKAAAKRREEEETSRREAALADGTADETPETSADFERLVASNPNSSEVWIKYMAFHLSLADIDSARNVANRAFERIEFRQEGEKLNVWTALLTLELKYGTGKSLYETVDRASSTNNPKQVYLRVCELLDKEVDAAASASGSSDLNAATKRADDMFTKMCKKFKSKKSVWIAHFQYLLKGSRHEEAHALLKRSLQSLPTYKHVEVMSKFAQMEFELGSPERGRTIFNALLEKHPKRMDLLFVNIDKEVKSGDMAKARALFDSVVNPVSHDRKQFKFSDKQMKSLFKKWYRMEEDHGDSESQERVKEEARVFVSKSSQ
eukprot:CAMPEP_0201661930 /NCGR_PEP_ID=MMETSP0494-20130426/4161_1 /ASSEMBLY_ACC=CAM_ASM_000839 /TAXON_ID=420259 /ORGANISM="Thalassiosira gravida, Strain GMp14c1" /LENGTH=2158 /DNA_ID=CAMNT_0048140171 /DNA_START=165 /DNA_END=6644 /DNA_ORIENTATION=+